MQEDQLGGYCNGQSRIRWRLRPDGRKAADEKSVGSGNISKEVLMGLVDSWKHGVKGGRLWVPPFHFSSNWEDSVSFPRMGKM